jgi:hypothetical protein
LIVHVPTASTVTLLPATLQMPGCRRGEGDGEAGARRGGDANGGSPKFLFASALKVIVWLAFDTVKPCETCGAALKPALPPWFAFHVQVPAPVMVRVVPETEQTPALAVLNTTARRRLPWPKASRADRRDLVGQRAERDRLVQFRDAEALRDLRRGPDGRVSRLVGVDRAGAAADDRDRRPRDLAHGRGRRAEDHREAGARRGRDGERRIPKTRLGSGSNVIVCELLVTGKLCATWGAEFHVALRPGSR